MGILKHVQSFRGCVRLVRQTRHLEVVRAPIHSSCCVLRKTSSYDADSELDKPVKFTTSQAARVNALGSFEAPKRDVPPYQPYVVGLSLIIFLVYFLVLREENDLDEELNRSLYDRVPGLELNQVKLSIDYNRQHGKPTEDLEKRLKELQAVASKQ